MKKATFCFFTGMVFLCLMNSCDLLDITFTTGNEELNFTVNPSDAGEYVFAESIMQTDLRQEIEDHGGSIDNLKNVTVNEAILTVLTSGKNLDPFSWIEVYVSTPNVNELMIASVYSIPSGSTTITLQLSDEELKVLVEEEEYTIRVIGELNEATPEAINFSLKLKYDVMVGV
jgi:hypothetical protein